MIISQDNEKLLTIKMTPRYIGLLFAGLMIGAGLLVFVIISATGAERRNGGMSRTPDGAPLLLVFVGVPVLLFFDWRRNRRSLTFDSAERKLTIVGSKPLTCSVDEIERFFLGATSNAGRPASQIEIQMKDGRRIGSGINSSFGSAEMPELAIKELGERLRAASQTA